MPSPCFKVLLNYDLHVFHASLSSLSLLLPIISQFHNLTHPPHRTILLPITFSPATFIMLSHPSITLCPPISLFPFRPQYFLKLPRKFLHSQLSLLSSNNTLNFTSSSRRSTHVITFILLLHTVHRTPAVAAIKISVVTQSSLLVATHPVQTRSEVMYLLPAAEGTETTFKKWKTVVGTRHDKFSSIA